MKSFKDKSHQVFYGIKNKIGTKEKMNSIKELNQET